MLIHVLTFSKIKVACIKNTHELLFHLVNYTLFRIQVMFFLY